MRKSINLPPDESMDDVISISLVVDFISSGKSMSNCCGEADETGAGGSDTPNHFATSGSDVPCTTRLTKVHRNTMLNISSLCGTPEARHRMAKIIGTAPLNPTQETNKRSLSVYFLNGANETNTERGLVTKIIIKLIIIPGMNTDFNSEGFTSRPKVRNIDSCDNQVAALKKLRVERLWTNFELPTINPAIYTAR